MPTIEEIRSVLAEINDPEIHRSIVELNMVRGIDLQGHRVTVDLALTIPGCPRKSFFQEVLPAKLKDRFPESTDVQINIGAMTADDRLINPPQPHTVERLAISHFGPPHHPVVWRRPILHKALQQYLSGVHSEETEYLPIDMPPGPRDISISLAQFAPGTRMILLTP